MLVPWRVTSNNKTNSPKTKNMKHIVLSISQIGRAHGDHGCTPVSLNMESEIDTYQSYEQCSKTLYCICIVLLYFVAVSY